MLSVRLVALRLGVSERRVQKLCETGRFKGANPPAGWMIPEEEVERYLSERARKGKENE